MKILISNRHLGPANISSFRVEGRTLEHTDSTVHIALAKLQHWFIINMHLLARARVLDRLHMLLVSCR